MGFFSKVWKGVKKTFKKIGKAIKKGFKKFGKFMGKIGIVGQIAMMFLLPGIGNAMLGTFGTALNAVGAIPGIGAAAQSVLGAAGNFARLVTKPFTTITDAISNFVGNTSKYLVNKTAQVFGKEAVFANAPTNFFGLDQNSVVGQFGENVANNVAGFRDVAQDLVTGDISAFTDKAFFKPTAKTEVFSSEIDPAVAKVKPEVPFPDGQPDSLLAVPEAGVPKAGVENFATNMRDKFVDSFSPTNLGEKTIEGFSTGVANVGSSAVMNQFGLLPEQEMPMMSYSSPNFYQRRDYTGGREPDPDELSYALFTQSQNFGDPRGVYDFGSAYQKWMGSNMQAASPVMAT